MRTYVAMKAQAQAVNVIGEEEKQKPRDDPRGEFFYSGAELQPLEWPFSLWIEKQKIRPV